MGPEFDACAGIANMDLAAAPRSAERELLGHVLPTGAGEEPERVLLHKGIVSQVEVELAVLLEAAEKAGLVLDDVERDLGVNPNLHRLLARVGAHAADGALDPA